MLNHILPPDTQAILLLCGSFGQNRQSEPQPLTMSEYSQLAKWLLEREIKPADLLEERGREQLETVAISQKLNGDRLVGLLERGAMLAFAVEKWTNQGVWVLARSDRLYPKRLKQQLKHSAPPILYGVGKKELLEAGGLAVVGSRDLDDEAIAYTEKVAQNCAQQGIQIVSGGARGVDSVAMLAAIAAGGTALGILADSLTKAAVSGQYRSAIREGQLTLVTAYDPDAGFSVGNAMGRNKYIYGLADYGLVVSSSLGKGGTWAGAIEALKRNENVPLFVRMQGNVPEGNCELRDRGAKVFPEVPWEGSLLESLECVGMEVESVQMQQGVLPFGETNATVEAEEETQESADSDEKAETAIAPAKEFAVSRPTNIYQAVLPLILEQLEQPKNEKMLAEELEVQVGQLRQWLKQAVDEGKVTKKTKPVEYVANREAMQLSFLE